MKDEELIEELIKFYYLHDSFQSKKLTESEVRGTISHVFYSGRIVTVEDSGQLTGYVESWRINFEQFGRILCQEAFHVGEENITDGNILYIANITVRPIYRKGEVIKMLRNRVFEQNKDAEYFVGEARRKRTGLVKVFKVSEISTYKEA